MSRASTVAGFEAGAGGRPEAVDRSGSELETPTLLSGRLETWLRKDTLIGSGVWNCSWSGSADKGLGSLSFGEVAGDSLLALEPFFGSNSDLGLR